MDKFDINSISKFNLQSKKISNISKVDKKLKELKEISNQFESIFINQILKQGRNNKIANGLFDSDAIKKFNSMIDNEYSKILSQKTKFGISEAIYNQFKNQITNEKKK